MPALRSTPTFLKAVESIKRDQVLSKRVRAALERFETNARHPGLHFEKLGGSPYHTIRATLALRIVLLPSGPDAFELIDLCGHDQVERRYG